MDLIEKPRRRCSRCRAVRVSIARKAFRVHQKALKAVVLTLRFLENDDVEGNTAVGVWR